MFPYLYNSLFCETATQPEQPLWKPLSQLAACPEKYLCSPHSRRERNKISYSTAKTTRIILFKNHKRCILLTKRIYWLLTILKINTYYPKQNSPAIFVTESQRIF
jgi:hypothetical protein